MLTRRSAHAHHGTKRRGELPRSRRSRISTSSWPKNLGRPIAHFRKDAAQDERQLSRVLARITAQIFDDVRQRGVTQGYGLKLASAVPRFPRALSRRALAEFVSPNCRDLHTLLSAQRRGFMSETQQSAQKEVGRFQIQTGN